MSIRGFLAFLLGITLAVALGIGSARAGYYAQVTSLTGSYAYGQSCTQVLASNHTTSCFLTPSMAINAIPRYTGTSWMVSALTETSGTAYWSYQGTCSITAAIGPCSAQPAATSFPTFVGSAADPVVLSGNYNNTGGTVTNPDPIQPLNPALAIEDSTALLGLGMLFLVPVWGARKLYDIFTSGGLS